MIRTASLACALSLASPCMAASTLTITPYTGLFVSWPGYLDGRSEAQFQFSLSTDVPLNTGRVLTLSDVEGANLSWQISARKRPTTGLIFEGRWTAAVADLETFNAAVTNIGGKLRFSSLDIRTKTVQPVNDNAGFGATFLTISSNSYVYSNGIGFAGGNVSDLPEPSSWATLLIGFAMIGIGFRSGLSGILTRARRV